MSVDLEAQVASVTSFSGGMSDFIFDGVPNEFQLAENLLLTPDEKLITRPGSEVNSLTVYQIPSGIKRIGALFTYEDIKFIQSERNIYTVDATLFNPVASPNPALSIGTEAGFISHTYWNRHIMVVNSEFAKPVKIFKVGTDYVVRTAGLPALASAPSGSGTAGANNYLYAFTMWVQYTIDGVVFEDEGPVTEIEVNNVNAPNVNNITLSSIPVLANGSVDNYDVTNIKIRIYRTENNQTVYYKIAEISNGTVSYIDSASDASINTNVVLYTTGDVVENDPPPPAKFVHSVEGYTYYAHIKEGGIEYKSRIRQSIQNDPDSVPGSFFVDLPQEIKGISSSDGNVVVFTVSKIYRLEGNFDELGNGGIVAREISETIGALNHNSIVQTRGGIFFAGNDGFYWTDGFQLKRINEKTINTYKTITESATQKARIYGAYDKLNDRVYWACMQTTGSTDNDTIFVVDLRFSVRPNSCFTTWVGKADFSPTAIAFFDNILYRGDRRGYLLKHDLSYLTDAKINTATTPNNWDKSTIIYNYKSTFSNFGMPYIRKWISRILLSLRNVSNVSVQMYSHNDDTNVYKPLVEVKDTSQIVWGDPNPIWGTDAYLWNFYKLIEEFRRFPAGSLRCSYKQLQITNSYTLITDSDSLGEATISPLTATLDVATDWPIDSVDYFISFETDNYVTEYLVQDVVDNVLTFADPTSTAPTGEVAWKLRGYAKGEILSLLGFVIFYSPISKSFKPYMGAS